MGWSAFTTDVEPSDELSFHATQSNRVLYNGLRCTEGSWNDKRLCYQEASTNQFILLLGILYAGLVSNHLLSSSLYWYVPMGSL
jgi:hypothetical protein